MNMKPEPEDEQKPFSLWSLIQVCVFALLVFLLLIRWAAYTESHSNIPPAGDPMHYNNRTGSGR